MMKIILKVSKKPISLLLIVSGLFIHFVQARPSDSNNSSNTVVLEEPSTIAVVRNDYRLVVGDTVRIVVYGEPNLTVSVRLDQKGSFNYPYLGEIVLVGKTLEEVESMIVDGLKGDYLVNPEVDVTIESYTEIYISGEVENPGNYTYRPGLTLSQFIALASGFTERASRNRIKVVPEGFSKEKGIPVELDYQLKPGDLVIVPRRFF